MTVRKEYTPVNARGIEVAIKRPSWNAESAAFYHTVRWRKKRRKILVRDPKCKICNRADSTVCDHNKAVEDGGAIWADDNLQGVCTTCHNIKSNNERHARNKKKNI